jgi:hypothetical protein
MYTKCTATIFYPNSTKVITVLKKVTKNWIMEREEQHWRQQFTAVTSRQHMTTCFIVEMSCVLQMARHRDGEFFLFGARNGGAGVGYQRNKIRR